MENDKEIISIKSGELNGEQGTISDFNSRDFLAAEVVTSKKINTPESYGKTIPTEDLYPLGDHLSSPLTTAFRLLAEATEKVNEAYDSFKNDDLISSNDAILHILAILPELFLCKEISEGFGTIINALFDSMKNHDKNGVYSLEQINMIRICLKRLATEPYIEFMDAIDIIMKLEETGFIVEPPHIEHFVEILND